MLTRREIRQAKLDKDKVRSPRPEITAIGIDFGDNDFHTTFEAVLKILQLAIYERGFQGCCGFPTTREGICAFVNAISFGVYQVFQSCGDLTPQDLKRTEAWLQIDESDILLNEEVDQHLTNDTGNFNGHFHYMYTNDLERVYSI